MKLSEELERELNESGWMVPSIYIKKIEALEAALKKVSDYNERLEKQIEELTSERRTWMDRYYTLYANVEMEKKILKLRWSEGFFEIIGRWAQEVNDAYKKDKDE